MELPDYLIRFYAKDEQLLMENTEDSQREFILELYSKSKVTVEDLQRNHTPDEVRELCVRTKLRVNMTYLNSVWDAKKLLNKTNCLDNLSESSINRELVKCVHSKMVQTYTDEDVADSNLVAKSVLKKDNNIRLDRWKRQRECLAPRAIDSPQDISESSSHVLSRPVSLEMEADNTNECYKESTFKYYQKCVTPEELQRKYTPDEVRELCVRTKLRVNMTYLNSVWDAKKLLNKMNCLDNLSESSINRELVKCVHSKMVQTYTDEDVANANRVAKSELKRANNIRLDRWKRQRECLSPRSTSSSLSTLSDTPSEDPSYSERPATPEFSSWDESDTDENQQDHPMDSVLYIKKEPKW